MSIAMATGLTTPVAMVTTSVPFMLALLMTELDTGDPSTQNIYL
jgi:hypothetical protein